MRYVHFLTFATIAYGGFGVGLFLLPGPFMAPYGVALDPAGEMFARVLGSALAASALVFWWIRPADREGPARAILRGHFVYNLADLPVVISATLAGTMNALGWVPVALHVALAAGFGYFGVLEARRRSAG